MSKFLFTVCFKSEDERKNARENLKLLAAKLKMSMPKAFTFAVNQQLKED